MKIVLIVALGLCIVGCQAHYYRQQGGHQEPPCDDEDCSGVATVNNPNSHALSINDGFIHEAADKVVAFVESIIEKLCDTFQRLIGTNQQEYADNTMRLIGINHRFLQRMSQHRMLNKSGRLGPLGRFRSRSSTICSNIGIPQAPTNDPSQQQY